MDIRKAPLRRVLQTVREGKDLVDELECGHRHFRYQGDPRTGFGGSWPAKRRRCPACLLKQGSSSPRN